MLNPIPHRRYNGTVLFFTVDKIKELNPETAYSCLIELNRVIAASAIVKKVGAQWIGCTVAGCFILIPDEASTTPHQFLTSLFTHFSEKGLPIRCGVAYGHFVCVEDADRQLNFVGRAINTAARLTYASGNIGCFVDSSYEAHFAGLDSAFFERGEKEAVSGKAHDEGFICRKFGAPFLTVLDGVSLEHLAQHVPEEISTGIVIAYDLPKFSAGDDSQIDKRVRSMVDTFRGIKENKAALKDATMYYCPGGDGGILVLDKVLQDGYEIGVSLSKAFLIENEYREEPIAVNARIGVHYGRVALYRSASGSLRPTGLACLVADDLTSDDAGKKAGLVFSEALKTVISNGSDQTLKREFEELPPLDAGPAMGLERFARKKGANVSSIHPLVEQLFGPTSSWQTVTEKRDAS